MIPSLAVELHRSKDRWGTLHVFEYQGVRYLTFGEGGEQSAINLNQPHTPLYEYTQAMLLALIFCPQPRHITLLGLGGGSLATTLLHQLPDSTVTAVELRRKVVDTAQQWFYLPDNPRLTIEIADAADFMMRTEQTCDLLFADIYLDEGMQQVQLCPDMLADCERILNDDGLLVLNLWDEGQGYHPLALERLSKHFEGHFLACPIEGGNLVLFASKRGLPAPDSRHHLSALRRLSKRIGNLPLQPLFERLRPLGGWD